MTPSLEKLRVLVVDDNPQMRTIVGAVLGAVGIRHIFFAGDGVAGLTAVHSRDVDVVYVDYEMPLMNGLDFISAVRAMAGDVRFLPIIMLTGYADRAHLNAARDRGVTEFLAKPVTARSILTRLAAVIDHPRAFVSCASYFGPDRRRRKQAADGSPRRRSTDAPDVISL